MKIPIENLHRKMVPNKAGVYFIWDNDKIIYVGSSWKLKLRLQPIQLYYRFILFGMTHIQWICAFHCRELEADLIRFFRPKLNQRFINNP